MLYSGTDPESYITEYTLVFEDKIGIYDLVRVRCAPLAAYRGTSPIRNRPPRWDPP